MLHKSNRSFLLRLILMFCISTAVSCFCCAKIVRARSTKRVNRLPTRTTIDSVRIDNALVGRCVVQLPKGSFVVMQVPLRFLSSQAIAAALAGDPNTPEDDLDWFQERSGSPWYVPEDNPSELTTFNCATHALGQAVGLSKTDWLDPLPQPWTGGVSGAEAILVNHFTLVAMYELNQIDWQVFENSSELQNGDVVIFMDANRGYNCLHFGRILKDRGGTTMISKIGTGPIAQGSPSRTARYFQGGFTDVWVFRQKLPGSRLSQM